MFSFLVGVPGIAQPLEQLAVGWLVGVAKLAVGLVHYLLGQGSELDAAALRDADQVAEGALAVMAYRCMTSPTAMPIDSPLR
ncbi:MAG: hypothetical protein M3O94_03570 [Actinomycetota bacterium]|nr:hypothetical protein [Actinomycetota bacterium]